MPNISFIDLAAQRKRIADKIDTAVLEVVHGGQYIMGPQIDKLERQLTAFCGTKHCISCSSGTDALVLVLMAKGVHTGQAIFVPAFTFIATAEVVSWLGAVPFFVDVREDTFNIDPDSLEQAITDAKEQGLQPSGIISVDLFGQPADYPRIMEIAQRNGLWVLADAAQSFGAKLDGKPVGTWGIATATSFFPAKPLGCYGDGGAVFTDDDEMAEVIDSLRIHGKGHHQYDNIRVGMNARFDTLQAAVLIEKLNIFPDELNARQGIAERYYAGFDGKATVPRLMAGATSSWAQYTLRLPEHVDRSAFIAHCRAAGVPTAIYYPIPLSQQQAYRHYPTVRGGVPVSERLSRSVVSLPMHPYLEPKLQDYIIETAVRRLS